MSFRPVRIVITGASRGIGAALAENYAGPGVSLALIGRHAEGLEGIAAGCRARGAAVETILLDVRQREALAQRLLGLDDAAPVDLVVANAGVALPTGNGAVDLTVYGEIDVNLVGALNTILPLAPRMAARGRGQIALMSSLAAFAPLPSSPGYGATKAALLVYGLALRERLRGAGVRVSVICPGYIDTEMGERYRGWRPLHMSAGDAARRIRRGLERDRGVIAFPRRLALVARLAPLVPERLRRIGLGAFRFRLDPTEG
ncbi:SDR family NAD(P)-dependent oxidoreductase [uncultured Enterovirga sp.]|uniref:SDR family NAD(P)-dependent oxidoreductase n=1 Tax=uncultured Enterovirga sp. TaxID=2026352 RepID=UPI0035CB49DF